MKVAVLFLTCGRTELSLQVIKQNFHNSQYNAQVVWIDNGSTPEEREPVAAALAHLHKTVIHFPENKGIATALNAGVKYALDNDYDAVVTQANDILMPAGWLAAMVQTVAKIPNTGMCGVHCVEALPEARELNGVIIHPNFTAFGNVLIPRTAFEKIGFFNEMYDPYGMQDGDFAYRLNKEGFINYYLHGMASDHIGHDVGNGTAYRAMKDEGLGKAYPLWQNAIKSYEDTGETYIAHGDYIINLEQFFVQ